MITEKYLLEYSLQFESWKPVGLSYRSRQVKIEQGLSLDEKEGWAEGRGGDWDGRRLEETTREASERTWRLTLRFHSVYLQVVMNVLKGWMCTGLCMSRWAIISIGSEVIVLCVLSCGELSLRECVAAGTLGLHGVGMCVSGKISTRYLVALWYWI